MVKVTFFNLHDSRVALYGDIYGVSFVSFRVNKIREATLLRKVIDIFFIC